MEPVFDGNLVTSREPVGSCSCLTLMEVGAIRVHSIDPLAASAGRV